MNIAENIKKIVVVNAAERPIFLKLLFHSFLIGLANSFFLVQASGNFISKVGLSEIPIAYIFSGILGLFIVQLFKKIQFKYGNNSSYKLIIYFFAISILLLSVGQIYFVKNSFFIKLLAYVGFELIFVFLTLFALGFNSVCTSTFSFSQSKRLIALLGTGEVVASIFGILFIPILKKYGIGNNYILIIAVVFAFISIIPIGKVSSTNGSNAAAKAIPVPKAFDFNYFVKNKYVFFLAITAFISVASYYFIDYSYMVSVRYLSELTSIEIVNIVAFYLFTSKLGELFFSLFSKNIIYSFGTETTLLLQPFLLLFFALFGIVCFFIFPSIPVFIVIFLLINKWIGTVIRKNITVPVRKIMFQMNSSEDMNYLQNNIEGLLTQISTIFFGIVLYIICFYSNVKNYQVFTTVITCLNLLIFLLYFIFSKQLYKAYKVQVRVFLNNIYKAPQKNTTQDTNYSKTILNTNISNESVYHEKFVSLFNDIDLQNKQKVISLITYYNPNSKSFFNTIHSDNRNDDSAILTQLKKLYFENQNYFSRYVVIAYLLNYDLATKISFLKDMYNVSELHLKMYLLENICADADMQFEENNSFFTEKLTDCIVEIVWAEAAMNDLNEDVFESLNEQLLIHKNNVTEMLLNFLQLISDKKTIRVVKNIYNKEDKTEDDLIFIVELLENVLTPEVKKLVLPIFEPISYSTRANKLSSICSNNELSSTERLSDILMYNFNIVNSYIKQLALKCLKLSNQKNSIVPAFQASQIPNLKMVASVNEEELTEDYVDYLKFGITNELSKYFSLQPVNKAILLRWGFKNINSNSFNKNENQLGLNLEKYSTTMAPNNQLINSFEVDLIAPYLLYQGSI